MIVEGMWGWQGTRAALYAAGRESITLTIEEVSPLSVGAIIALYERAVGLYASLINVNAYHQPGRWAGGGPQRGWGAQPQGRPVCLSGCAGVEAGKKAAGEVLGLQKRVQSVIKEARWARRGTGVGPQGLSGGVMGGQLPGAGGVAECGGGGEEV